MISVTDDRLAASGASNGADTATVVFARLLDGDATGASVLLFAANQVGVADVTIATAIFPTLFLKRYYLE
jgi:hypothetical protein